MNGFRVTKFTITKNNYLKRDIQAFYSDVFYGRRNYTDNPDYVYKIKNDPHHNWSRQHLDKAVEDLRRVLSAALPEVFHFLNKDQVTVCVVPRAKRECCYKHEQKLFKATVSTVIEELSKRHKFNNGTDFLTRHTDTKTTHLRKEDKNFPNNGSEPYVGITKETCNISAEVIGKDILLIDDLYTKKVNIDEDAIQALIDKGAKSVAFYAACKTASWSD